MAAALTYKYLQLVNYSALFLWDIKRYFTTQVLSTFPIVRLGDYITEESTKYSINDPTKTYGILGVNNQTGIFDAYIESGSKIKQKYKKMHMGWIAYNPYRINVGSIGIRTNAHLHEYISPAYVVFSCRSGLLPDFLFLLIKTDLFNKVVRENTTGSVRQNLSFSVLSNFKIPLPSLEEQNAIVAAYKNSISLVEQYEEQVKTEERNVKQYTLQELGFWGNNSNSKTKEVLMYFRKLSELSVRWDVWNVADICYKGTYKLIPLSKVIKMTSGQFLPAREQIDGQYHVYGGNGKTGTHNKYCFSGKRIVIGRVGEYCGNVHLVDGEYWITDNALKVDKIYDGITWDYLAIALKALNINQYKSISAQPSISQSKILQLQIPLPPIDVQNEIVAHITKSNEYIKSFRTLAATTKTAAIKQFEQTLFE